MAMNSAGWLGKADEAGRLGKRRKLQGLAKLF